MKEETTEAPACSPVRELVFSRAMVGGVVSIRWCSDGGRTVHQLTKADMEGISSTLRKAGYLVYGQSKEMT